MKTIDMTTLDRWAAEHAQDEAAYVKPASDWAKEVEQIFHGEKQSNGKLLPWGKIQHLFNIRPHEVTLWLGFNGHGKSLVLGQVLMSLMNQGDKALIASMEMRPASTMARMCRQASQGESPSVAFIQQFHRWTDERLWIYDQHGTVSPQRILNLCRYSHEVLGIKQVVIDSLMKVVHDEEDTAKVKGFVDGLCTHARDTGQHIHLVHHSRKGLNEETPPGKMDARGAGAITDLVDNCVTVWRNKQKAEAEARGVAPKHDFDGLLKVDKQRHGDWEGAIGLWFHKPSTQFIGHPHASPMDFM